jgi:hypothetical protein
MVRKKNWTGESQMETKVGREKVETKVRQTKLGRESGMVHKKSQTGESGMETKVRQKKWDGRLKFFFQKLNGERVGWKKWVKRWKQSQTRKWDGNQSQTDKVGWR